MAKETPRERASGDVLRVERGPARRTAGRRLRPKQFVHAFRSSDDDGGWAQRRPQSKPDRLRPIRQGIRRGGPATEAESVCGPRVAPGASRPAPRARVEWWRSIRRLASRPARAWRRSSDAASRSTRGRAREARGRSRRAAPRRAMPASSSRRRARPDGGTPSTGPCIRARDRGAPTCAATTARPKRVPPTPCQHIGDRGSIRVRRTCNGTRREITAGNGRPATAAVATLPSRPVARSSGPPNRSARGWPRPGRGPRP